MERTMVRLPDLRPLLGWIAAAAATTLIIALVLLPPEQILGNVIKVIFLHGALVRVGLLLLGAAGLLGALALITRRDGLCGWTLASLEAGIVIWLAYIIASMVSTRMSWGEWIAWEEPRVRASFHVLWFTVACLGLALWVGHRTFTAAVTILAAIVAWVLVRGAILLRHPFDPIGTSSSNTYLTLYWVMVVALLVLAAILVRWLHERFPSAATHS